MAQARQLISKRTFTATARQLSQTQTPTPAAPTTTAEAEVAETVRPASAVMQAPNRAEVWSRSQRPRSEAMTGPRFEQTDFDAQVRSLADAK